MALSDWGIDDHIEAVVRYLYPVFSAPTTITGYNRYCREGAEERCSFVGRHPRSALDPFDHEEPSTDGCDDADDERKRIGIAPRPVEKHISNDGDEHDKDAEHGSNG